MSSSSKLVVTISTFAHRLRFDLAASASDDPASTQTIRVPLAARSRVSWPVPHQISRSWLEELTPQIRTRSVTASGG